MIGTGRSAVPRVNAPQVSTAGLPRWQRITLLVLFDGALCWAGGVLLGRGFAVVLLTVALVGRIVDRLMTDAATRTQGRAVHAALLEHSDPGPQLRPHVERMARQHVRTEPRRRWLLGLGLSGFALACVVAAVHRGDVTAALPAPILLAGTVAALVLSRRIQAAAERWLDDPPMDTADARGGPPRSAGPPA